MLWINCSELFITNNNKTTIIVFSFIELLTSSRQSAKYKNVPVLMALFLIKNWLSIILGKFAYEPSSLPFDTLSNNTLRFCRSHKSKKYREKTPLRCNWSTLLVCIWSFVAVYVRLMQRQAVDAEWLEEDCVWIRELSIREDFLTLKVCRSSSDPSCIHPVLDSARTPSSFYELE